MYKKLFLYLLGFFLLWSAYTIYIFSFQEWIKQALTGLASILLFFVVFAVISYALKK